MDPGELPAVLFKLSQMEELLIARVHMHVQVKRVRGYQYQYTGHMVSFMQNIVRVFYSY